MQGPNLKPVVLVSENKTRDRSDVITPLDKEMNQVCDSIGYSTRLTKASISCTLHDKSTLIHEPSEYLAFDYVSSETDNDPVVPELTQTDISNEQIQNESSSKRNADQNVVDTSCYSSAMILTGVMKQAKRSAQPSSFDLLNMKCTNIITYATLFVRTAIRMKLFPNDVIPTSMVMSPYQWLTKLNLSSNDGVSHPPS